MSRQDALSFVERLRQDAALRQAADKSPADHLAESLVALGAEQGLSFTEGELTGVLDELRRGAGGSELTDEELEAVAGGRESFKKALKMIETSADLQMQAHRNVMGS